MTIDTASVRLLPCVKTSCSMYAIAPDPYPRDIVTKPLIKPLSQSFIGEF